MDINQATASPDDPASRAPRQSERGPVASAPCGGGAALSGGPRDSRSIEASRRPRTRSILILGGDADGNLGDRAILLSTCLGLATVANGVELWTLSSRLPELAAPIGVRTVPRGLGRLLRLCIRAARSDLVLCGGGGLFQDDDSLVKMPYWALRLALMRIFCRRIVGYSLGVGPLRAATSKAFARLAFACMWRITVRDPTARASAAPLTAKKLDILPDPAFLTPAVPEASTRAWLENQRIPLDGRLLIGVTTRRWFPVRYRLIPNRITARLRRNIVDESPEARRYIALLAEALDRLAQKHDARILFMPTYNVVHEGDDQVCTRVAQAMAWPLKHMLIIDDPTLYKGVVGHLAVLVTGRMHPAIFAASAGTPFVALAYNQKFFGLGDLLGSWPFVMNVNEFVEGRRVDDLCAMVEGALERRGDDLSDRCRGFAAEIHALNRQMVEEHA